LKAFGKKEVADILNNMASDDRMGLLEELRALATKSLVESLTPTEREVALTLLWYC
jgi:Mg/Co/Ni transporter MgtE